MRAVYKETLQTHYDKQTIISPNLYQIPAYLTNLESLGGVNVHCEKRTPNETTINRLNWKNGAFFLTTSTFDIIVIPSHHLYE